MQMMSYQPQKHSQSDVKIELQEDWDNRDIAALISHNVKKISDFLCNFELSCKYKINLVNERLNSLEKKIEYLEANVTKSDTLN
ncbi:Protein BRICK1 [Trichinella pseudospiralis]|uniref:Protein BRICK1 n=1 Tax=Trichinella pseudospiralis TaxID=6337 RepID=A0A0V1FHU9_TRIPS|nr:Protein BRICK1 [Trichinella pseudospiralis]